MFCPQCGASALDSDSFCSSCGTQVRASDKPKVSKPIKTSSPEAAKPASAASNLIPRKNSLSTVSLVLGIVSVFLFEFLVFSIAAVITASLALSKSSELAREGIANTGKGKSIAGLILGVVYSLLGVYYLLAA
jgi:uncharacterized membrane protein YvbJ